METAIIITGDFLGKGNDELGKTLMKGYLKNLCNTPKKPEIMVFYHSGVKLLVQGSSSLESLCYLAEQGVDLIACTTCIEYYELKEEMVVGRQSNMEEIIQVMTEIEKVVTL